VLGGAALRGSAAPTGKKEITVSDDLMIAIIDDDESIRVGTESLVRSLGLAASTFASAEEFLTSPRLNGAACLITDVQMPGMSGIDLQAYLQQRGRTIPMIFITAFPEENIRRKVNVASAIGFLSKPFDGGAMIACIDRPLGH
jgi:FixJ family two-component response regulator